MVNSDSGGILREVIRAVAREYGWEEFLPAPYEVISLDRAKLEKLSGRYLVSPDRVLTLRIETTKDGPVKLIAAPTADLQFEMLPISETTFVRRGSTIKYEFVLTEVKGVENTPTTISTAIQLIFPNGAPARAERITDGRLVPTELLLAGKIGEAVEGYRKIQKDTPGNASISEQRLNALGYGFLQQKKLAEALALFKLNVEFYPNAWNAYDSLAEAYAANGETALAIANYKKSLELNPNNPEGREKLKKLGGQ
jgi:hypothetical protein